MKVGIELSKSFSIAKEVSFPQAVKKEFELAEKLIEEGKKFSQVFEVLSDVEKTLIDNAVKGEFLGKSFSILSKRMKDVYLSRIRIIPPVVYGFSILLSILTAMSLIGSVIIPYLKMIRGLAQ